MGLKPLPSMDRETAVVSDVQISFMDNIAKPAYQILSELFPQSEEVVNRVKQRRLKSKISAWILFAKGFLLA